MAACLLWDCVGNHTSGARFALSALNYPFTQPVEPQWERVLSLQRDWIFIAYT